jgi:hypothetical protein
LQDDIEQGLLGDCWLLSAMSAVAHSHGHILEKYTLGNITATTSKKKNEKNKKNDIRKNCSINKSFTPISKDGKYDIRIHVDGNWKVITVDDRLPCLRQSQSSQSSTTTKSSATPTLVPAFGRSSTKNELWVSLLEKAIAKHYGSYEAITGGLIHVAMSLLTGGIGEMIKIEQAKKLGHVTNGRLWNKMYKLHKDGHLLAAGSPPISTIGQTAVSDMGIVHGHAYAILRLIQVCFCSATRFYFIF